LQLCGTEAGSFLARDELVQPYGGDPHVEHDDVKYTAIGDRGRRAKPELAGLVIYVASMAGFLFWLLRYGVNV
jgi:hypothetical protein